MQTTKNNEGLNEPIHGYIVYKVFDIPRISAGELRNHLEGSEEIGKPYIAFYLQHYKYEGEFDFDRFNALLEKTANFKYVEVYYSLRHLEWLKNILQGDYFIHRSFDLMTDYSNTLNVKLADYPDLIIDIEEIEALRKGSV